MMPLRILAVDDEPPALEDLTYLLRGDTRVGRVLAAGSTDAALRLLESETVDAVFLDIRMPGLDGLDLVRVLRRFAEPPSVVFVTAYDDFAVDAFALKACDYLLKPVRRERLAEAVRRVADLSGAAPGAAPPGLSTERIPVDLGGVTRFVPRDEVAYVEAQGDYVRLHARGEAPWSGCRWRSSKSAGCRTDSSASTGGSWSRCGTSRGCARWAATGPCRWRGTTCRSAAATPGSCGTC